MNPRPAEPVSEWNPQRIRDLFSQSADVHIISHRMTAESSSEVVLIYCEGLCDSSVISKFILTELEDLYQSHGFAVLHSEQSYGSMQWIRLDANASSVELADHVFEGNLLLFFPEAGVLFKMVLDDRPKRTPFESAVESAVKGTRDGFIEDIVTNMALIRKRIRSPSLNYEIVVLGRRTRTKVGLLYFRDILNPEILHEVRRRLNKIDTDGLYSINQLEEMLADNKYPLFPLLDFTGRPDKAVSSLLAGRFVILLDGNPFALIGPATFELVMKSPEDLHFNFQYVSYSRLIRIVAFLISATLPGFWVALTAFHQDQIPFQLLATISAGRLGLPLSPQLELFILVLLMEIFREAGLRIPLPIGQTITTIGGLIIGDSAIRAGLVSPSTVVVGALTAVSAVTLVNQTLSTALSLVRLFLFIMASALGMYGMLLGLVLLVFYMARLRSFGIPYLAPLSPPVFKDMLAAALRLPWRKMKDRPSKLQPTDPDR